LYEHINNAEFPFWTALSVFSNVEVFYWILFCKSLYIYNM